MTNRLFHLFGYTFSINLNCSAERKGRQTARGAVSGIKGENQLSSQQYASCGACQSRSCFDGFRIVCQAQKSVRAWQTLKHWIFAVLVNWSSGGTEKCVLNITTVSMRQTHPRKSEHYNRGTQIFRRENVLIRLSVKSSKSLVSLISSSNNTTSKQ